MWLPRVPRASALTHPQHAARASAPSDLLDALSSSRTAKRNRTPVPLTHEELEWQQDDLVGYLERFLLSVGEKEVRMCSNKALVSLRWCVCSSQWAQQSLRGGDGWQKPVAWMCCNQGEASSPSNAPWGDQQAYAGIQLHEV